MAFNRRAVFCHGSHISISLSARAHAASTIFKHIHWRRLSLALAPFDTRKTILFFFSISFFSFFDYENLLLIGNESTNVGVL